jgi:hypothetical protein
VYGCVDEAHLINIWGVDFPPDFKHIGRFFRSRLSSHASIMALSAILQPGSATNSVCSSLGGDNHYIFRSTNERPNTQFVTEPLENGVRGKIFPQLLPYLNSRRKAVVHCRTIYDVLRVFLYLWKALPPGPHRLRRLKMYHSLRSCEENVVSVPDCHDIPIWEPCRDSLEPNRSLSRTLALCQRYGSQNDFHTRSALPWPNVRVQFTALKTI